MKFSLYGFGYAFTLNGADTTSGITALAGGHAILVNVIDFNALDNPHAFVANTFNAAPVPVGNVPGNETTNVFVPCPDSINAFTASVCNLRPTSRGSVHINSIDPEAPPVISPNYLSTDEDRKVAAESLRLTRKIVEQAALGPYAPEEYKPGVQYQTDEELVKAAGDIGTTIFHPVGTCKMGRADDPMAVLDSQLRVRGIHHLRVVDASAMPTITSGNTAAPTMMIAERVAELLTRE